MSEPSIFFSEVNERQGVFNRRAFLMGGLAGGGILALGGRLAQLQVLEFDRYRLMSTENQFNFRLIPPPRGRILDRFGVELASNRPNFRVLLVRDEINDIDATLDALAQLIPITPERRRQLLREISRSPKLVPVAVAEDLTWEEFSRVNVRTPELPGVTADMGEARVYPHGGAFAHVVGYVAKVSDRDIAAAGLNPDPLLHHPGFRIGKQGVEKALDTVLRGKSGAVKTEVDALGREVRKDPEGDINPIAGKTVVLSLDADVQSRALEVLGEDSGACVVIDVQSGDLICMASAPSFDANQFVRGLTSAEYRALSEYERRPLLDKALSGTYPPGSTFKPMTALAALDSGMVNPNETVVCSGQMWFGNRFFHCWKRGGHGPQNMHEAIKNSCDIYFYQVALKIGPDRIARVAEAFGMGQTFEIGISGQKAGLVPSTAWKRRQYRQPWYPGESLSFGIGQGALSANALQLAVMTARLANGYKALNPRLIKSIGGVETPSGAAAADLPFKPEHMELVRSGMAAVANDTTGTAYRASQLGLGPVLMAGKTGTAQVRVISRAERASGVRSNESLPWRLRDHALFVAFAPYDAPRYALSIIVQHGGGGASVAAPKAREIMRVVLLKDAAIRARIESPLPMPEAPMSTTGEVEGEAPPPPSDAILPAAAPTVSGGSTQ
jgi:penicillin-binding protein 2